MRFYTCEYLEKKGAEITYLDVDGNGLVNLDELQRAIRPETILISIMFANNEIGTIEPVKEIGMIAKEHGVFIPYKMLFRHSDRCRLMWMR